MSPTAAFHSLFWEEQAAAPVGPTLTALSRILGPPLISVALLVISAGALF